MLGMNAENTLVRMNAKKLLSQKYLKIQVSVYALQINTTRGFIYFPLLNFL